MSSRFAIGIPSEVVARDAARVPPAFQPGRWIATLAPLFSEAGQDFEEFRLQSLLGTGGMSRVFLASDLSLGGKRVVLKVTVDRGQEPKVQGPLDHPHIVPVNSVAYQTDSRLCGLSMPYRPGLDAR